MLAKQTFISFDKFSALNSLKSISYKSIDKKVTFSYMSCITYCYENQCVVSVAIGSNLIFDQFVSEPWRSSKEVGSRVAGAMSRSNLCIRLSPKICVCLHCYHFKSFRTKNLLKENQKTLFKKRLFKAKMEFARLDCFIKKKHAKILLL